MSTLGRGGSSLCTIARHALRANKNDFNGRWISTSNENKRSDVLTQREEQQQNAKLKLEQQERWRMKQQER